MHTTVNPRGTMIKDAEVDLVELHEGREVPGVGLGNLALAGGFAMAPIGGPGRVGALDALLILDMLSLGASTPDHAVFQDTLLAWMPVELAGSREEAQRVFHKMLVESMKKALNELDVVYRHAQNERGQGLFGSGDPVLSDSFIPEAGIPGVCTDCFIWVKTGMPDKKPVMSPARLTGHSYLSYRFNSYFDKSAALKSMTNRLVMFDAMKSGERYEKAGLTHWPVRDFEALKWLSDVNPDWAVMYMQGYKPERQAEADSGDLPGGNPFPFMVHKGQVRFFVEGDN